MFWNYVMQPGIFYPSFIHPFQPTLSAIPQPPMEPQISPHTAEGLKSHEQGVLELTKQDLLEAGYDITKKPWSEEEDSLLRNLRDKKCLDWNQIAQLIPERNSKMCYSRYRRLENHCKQIWRKADDERLLQLVEQHGENWKLVSQHFNKRTQKQVKEHYLNYLRPEIKKDQWVLEEDLKLIQLLRQFGTNWKIIEENFGGRTQNQIKNRYFGRLKRLAEKKMNAKIKNARPETI